MWGGIFEKNKIKEKIQAFNKKIVQENFWKEKLSAQKILKEKKFLETILDEFNFAVNELDNLEISSIRSILEKKYHFEIINIILCIQWCYYFRLYSIIVYYIILYYYFVSKGP